MKKKNNNQQAVKKKENSLFPLYLQAGFSVITLILLIVFFINKDVVGLLQMSIGITLIITGYNNHHVYKRSIITTIANFFVGLILLVLSVISIMGI